MPAPIDLTNVANGTGGFVIYGQDADDNAGWSVASAGDINGDGFDDVIIGTRGGDGAGNAKAYAGDSYVVFGKASGFAASIDLVSVAGGTGGFVIYGQNAGDRAGYSVASAGDINGDGYADLVIGANRNDGSGNDAGGSYVVFGKAAGFGASVDLGNVAAGTGGFVIQGQDADDRSGFSVASAGDINGDGFDDLIIGAAGGDAAANGKTDAGDSYVLFGRASGFAANINLSTVAAGTGGFVIFGAEANDYSGRSVASAGDINGDGFADLIIAAWGGDAALNAKGHAGESYVVFGKASGFGASVDLTNVATGSGGFVIYGQDANDYSGWQVASAGDINGDGFLDIIIGAIWADAAGDAKPFAGDSYVVFGKATGFGASVDLSAVAGGTGGFVLFGQDTFDYTGRSVAAAGDVNGDGFDDLLIGAKGGDAAGNLKSSAGQSYVVFGKASSFGASLDLSIVVGGFGGFVIYGQDTFDYSGQSVSSAGDVNGDGFDDLLIGAYLADAAGNAKTGAGDSYVIFGGNSFTSSVTHQGSSSADTLTGSASANVMVGGQGNDTLLGAGGADVMRGGAGDDVLSVADLTFADLDGGSGNDTLALSGAGFTLDLGAITNPRLTSIEAIDLTGSGNNALVLTALELLNLSGSSNALRIDGNAGDTVSVTDFGWTKGATAGGYTTYTQGQASLNVATAIAISLANAPIDLTNVAAGTGGFVIFGQDAGDFSGRSVASAGDVNGDGFDDLIIGAPFADSAVNLKSSAGDSYVVFGKAGGFAASISLSAVAAGTGGFVILGLDASDFSGVSVASAGDINGDGFADLVIGAKGGDAAANGKSYAGETYVVFGKAASFGASINLSAVATGTGGFVLYGRDADDQSGISVSSAGDINGDGFSDIIIGAPKGDAASNGKAEAGESYVVFGKAGGFAASIDLDSVAAGTGGFVVYGQLAGERSGRSVSAAGDVNGDGLGDLIIGAYFGSGGGTGGGDSYVVFGKTTSFGASLDLTSVALGSGGFVIHGQVSGDRSGNLVAAAGDVNGDGFADLLIGANRADGLGNLKNYAGDTYVVFGKASSFGASLNLSTVAAGTGGFVIYGQDVSDFSGWSASGAGDVNADGYDDLLIGALGGAAAGNAKSAAGESYLIFGKAGGFGASVNLSTVAAGTGGFIIYGQDANDKSSYSVAAAGDINGDGFDDLVIGAYQGAGAANATVLTGDSYVIFGTDFLGTVTHQGSSSADTLTGSASANMMVGGQGDDTLVGAGGADVMRGGSGNDVLSVVDLTFANIDGSSGSDTLALTGSGMALNLGAVADSRLTDIEAIDLTGSGNNTLTLTALEVLNLSSTSNTLRVDGNAGDAVSAAGPWIQGAQTVIGSSSYAVYVQGAATLQVQLGVTQSSITTAEIQLSYLDGSNGFRINGETTSDRFGYVVSNAGDVNGDGFDDILVGAKAHSVNGGYTYEGASYVVFGKASGFAVSFDLSTLNGSNGFEIDGEAAVDYSGSAVSSAGDVNGDGFADLLISAYNGRVNGVYLGASYVVFGKASGFAANLSLSALNGSNGFRINGKASGDGLGSSVASAGDVNGDGFDDLLIGASGRDVNGINAGASYVVFGRSGGFGAVLSLAALGGSNGFQINGEAELDFAGNVSSAGDVNGDGLDDLLIGASGRDTNGSLAGASYVVFGKTSGFGANLDLSTLNGSNGFEINGEAPNDVSGSSVSSAGDINGDGYADLLIGAYSRDVNGVDAGASYVVFGKAGGFSASLNLSALNGSNGFEINGEGAEDWSGVAVSGVGDINGDGFDDLLIGAKRSDANGIDSGASYLLFGKASGFSANLNLSTLNGTNGLQIDGNSFDLSGTAVSGAGDVNGDGFADLLIGAPGNTTGASYVLFGRDFTNSASQIGSSGGDVLTGTSGADILISGLGNDTLIGAGGLDVMHGGGGDDVLRVSDLTFADLDGGSGTDTLALTGSGRALNLGAIADTRLTDIEAIDLTGSGNNTLTLTALEVLNLSSTSNALRVDGNAGDQLVLGDAGWLRGATVGGYTSFAAGQATLSVATAITISVAPVELASVAAGTGGFAIYGRDAGDQSGRSVASAGDINGDGFDDLIIGAPFAAAAGNAKSTAGESYVVFGKAGGFSASVDLDAVAAGTGGFVLYGQFAGDYSGLSAKSAGDINGDGFADLVIGAQAYATGAAGNSYVLFGHAGAFAASIDLGAVAAGTGGFVIHGQDGHDYSGNSVASAGDVNGDGFGDLIIGAYQGDSAGNARTNAGEVYVVFGHGGGFGANIELSAVATGAGGFVILGQDAGDHAGASVASAGDINGDGFADLIIGAPNGAGAGNSAANAGDSYVLFGHAGSFGASIDLVTVAAGTGGFAIHGQDADDQSGVSVASAGDINRDGFDDLIIGAPFAAGAGNAAAGAGDSYVLFGKAGGFGASVGLDAVAGGTGGFVLHGQRIADGAGWSVASAGDVNGDGMADLIIGAVRGDPGIGDNNAGLSYVVFGKTTGFGASIDLATIAAGNGGFVLNGSGLGDQSGFSVATAGDINGDGFDDLLVGANYGDALGYLKTNAGDSWVIFGRDFTGTVTQQGTANADSLNGSASADVMIGGQGNDTLIGAGGLDVMRGGAGNDVLRVSDLSFADIDGGSGTDTLALTGSGMTLDLGALANTRLTDIEAIDLTGVGNNTLTLTALELLNLSSTSNTLRIDGNAGDQLTLGDAGWLRGATAGGYTSFSQGQATLSVATTVAIASAPIDLVNIAAGTGGFVIFGQDAGDSSGFSVASAGDVNGDGFADLIIGAPVGDAAGNAKANAGESYVVYGRASGFGASIALSAVAAGSGGFVIYGQDAGDQSGRSVASAGDINGDGFGDLIIGALLGDAAGNAKGNAGDSYVVFGNASGFGAGIDLGAVASGSGGFVIYGPDAGDLSGFSVASGGDINGDGLDDLVIGANNADAAGNARADAGECYVLFGRTSGFGASIDLGALAAGTGGFVIYGQDVNDEAGRSVARAGDINGDGFGDLIIGAPYADAAGNAKADAGESYVVFGRSSGFGAGIDLSTVAAGSGGFVIYGQDPNDLSGYSVAAAGDLNGDGFDDLIIGSPYADATGNARSDGGESYVVFGKASGFGASIDLNAVAAGNGGFVIYGQDANDLSGYSVAAAGDLNGDGFDDLIIGSPFADAAGNDKSSAGDSFVVFGKAGGFGASIELAAVAAGSGGFVIYGQDAGDRSGYSVAAAGDINGDGFDDLIVGSPLGDAAGNATSSAGDSHVIFGADFTHTVTHQGTSSAEVLSGSASADVMFGGLGNDTLIGAGGLDVMRGGAGDDVLRVSDLTFADLNGGSGTDTLALTGAGMTLDLGAIANTRLTGIEAIDLTGSGNNTLTLTALEVLNLSSTSNTLRIDGNAGDQLTLGDAGWLRGATAGGYTSYVSGQALLQVASQVALANAPIYLANIAAGSGGFVIYGRDALDSSGAAVALAGDINGDGFDDLIIGASGGDGPNNANNSAGESYVVFGKAGGFGAAINLGDVAAGSGGFVIYGQDAGDVAGFSVAPAGDFNHDGFDDLIIGSVGDGTANSKVDAGESYVVFGKATGFGAAINLGDVAIGAGGLVIYGRDANDRSGYSATAAGDINGDGFDDLVIGAHFGNGAANAVSHSGESYVIFGRASGLGASIDLGDVAAGTGGFVIYGQDASDYSGRSLASVGDINGDGFGDLVIGATGGDGAGNARSGVGESYVVLGKAGGFGAIVNLGDVAAGTGGFAIYGRDTSDYSGLSVASAGDINGDGLGDLVIGAAWADGAGNAATTSGESYVVFGKTSGLGASVNLESVAAGTGGFVIYGRDAGDYSGVSVASAGDINGDGFDDLLIGATQASGSGNAASNAGESYVLFGKAGGFGSSIDLDDVAAGTGGFVIYARDAGDDVGRSVASAGDINGDGYDDLIIGAPSGAGPNNDATKVGESYVIFGRDFNATVTRQGGVGADTLYGTAGADVIVGGQGNDTLVGAGGADVMHAGAGDDIMFVNDLGFAQMDGGSGIDTLAINGSAQTLDLTQLANTRITDVEVIYLSGADNNTLVLNALGVLNLSSTSNTLRVDGAFGSNLVFADTGWTKGATDASHTTWTNGQASMQVALDVAVSSHSMPIELGDIARGSGGFVIYGQEAGDGSGYSVASAGDINGDGFDDMLIWAIGGAGAGNARAGAADSYVVFGNAGGFGAPVDLGAVAAGTGGFVIYGQDAGDYAGHSLASAGDINGDGNADLLIGAPNGDGANNARNNAGETYLVFGKGSGLGAPIDLGDVARGTGGFVMYGLDAGDQSGYSVAGAGDINGDGFDDLIIGAHYGDGVGDLKNNAGETYVVFGKAGGFASGLDLGAAATGSNGFVIHGVDAGDQSGNSVASGGDINGDGLDDLVIGAANASAAGNGTNHAGESYVVFGRSSGFAAPVDLSDVASGSGGFVIRGQDVGDFSGWSVASAGDINGDGFADLIIGALRGDAAANAKLEAGETYVVLGKAGGFGASIELTAVAAGTGGFVVYGQDADDRSGYSVAGAGDVNGDGLDDLIIGANRAGAANNSATFAGDSYVVFGKHDGFAASLDLSSVAAGTGGFVIHGQDTGDFSGRSVAPAGDVNGDGYADLLIGAPGGDGPVNGTSGAGESYVIFGRDFTNTASQIGGAGGDAITGTSLADILVGGLGNDTLDGRGGADVLRGGAGDDLLCVADLTFADIDGGSGTDTLALTGAGMVLDLTQIANTRLTDIEAIDLTGSGNNRLTLTALELLNLSGSSNTLRVDGNAGDVVHAAGTWTRGANTLIGSNTYAVYAQGAATLQVELGVVAKVAEVQLSALDGSNGFRINGEAVGDWSGRTAASAGDVNGDGLDDVIIGAFVAGPHGAQSGASYVIYGWPGGYPAEFNLDALDSAHGFKISGEAAGDRSGFSVASAGDVNADGFSDLIIGADHAGPNGNYSGASYVVFGGPGGFGANLDLSTLNGSNGFQINGAAAGDKAGASVASGGDEKGD